MKEFNDNNQFEDILRSLVADRLTDSEPLEKPNLFVAQSQVKATIKGTSNKKKLWMYMAAASVALIVGVSVFFALNNVNNGENLAQNSNESDVSQENDVIGQDTVLYIDKTNKRNTIDNVESESKTETTDKQLQASNIERKYANSEIMGYCEMITPNKENYNILCKNLDKVFTFKWKSENVKSQVFTIRDSHGNVIVETSNATLCSYEMPYRKVYPEKKLTWSVAVVCDDGSKIMRNGTINITYEL